MNKWLLYLTFVPSGFFFAQQSNFSIPYETFQLNNGLTVILHEDHSDPVVAVNLTVHVGSAREKEGRTGFAHLFEHLLFLESENLGKGGLDILSAKIGGSGANGSTSRDRTNYLQTIPKDALEKMIWAEADKLGWFINTVTDPVLAKEKQVVKNEKRQSYDNNPYGHTMYVHGKALYPKDHPYNWQVIGSLEDLDNATLEDVKEFYRKWYVPNNVVLVIAGDFKPEEAKALVKKYFDEIPAGPTIDKLPKVPAHLRESKHFFHEDNFARVPALTYSWPTVEKFNRDSYALAVLTRYLTEGKNAPFYKILVEESQMTDDISMYTYDSEMAGETYLEVTAYPGFDLNQVATAIEEAFALFEKEGISERDLNRIKAQQEMEFYISLNNVLNKSEALAEYQLLTGDPGYASREIQLMMSVTKADIMNVYSRYFNNKPYISTSFVPKGQLHLALTGAEKAEIVEEEIIEGAEEDFDASIASAYERTPSKIDREKEPEYGEKFSIQLPKIDETKFKNGLKLLAIENTEVPLVQFQLIFDAGQKMEDLQGSSYQLANVMMGGTQYRSAAELEDAIEQLGSTISITSGKEQFVISGVALKKNFKPTMQLVSEIVLSPRWDENELQLSIQSAQAMLEQQKSNAHMVTSLAFNELLYGPNHVMAKNQLGTTESLNAMTMDQLKALYQKVIAPQLATINIVGDTDAKEIKNSIVELIHNWERNSTKTISLTKGKPVSQSQLYFVDFPEAKQSVIRVGAPSLTLKDKDYYNGVIANYILGGGGFASRLMQELREGKGYTYGVNSSFSGGKDLGQFDISTGVRSNATMESLTIIKQILDNYPETFTEEDLEATKGYLAKSQARNFETFGAKLNVLYSIGVNGLPKNYIQKRQAMVDKMTVKKIKMIAKKYMNPNQMIWLVTGDGKTQKDRLEKAGLGQPIEIKK